ncbi:hypothetical protein [Roseiconus lacunae]|uniref:Glycine zipper family protein n=1 Tax=Roseiconus lacunae TaxID=2605694 RepID=A0ABT7PII4_9BACT|nr:hypothetical protein [Roseiconus lacunae]MDM4016310.1 hypothetical protein [Roseiconus lacunae]
MTRDTYRSIGAITGLAIGIVLMRSLGLGGIIYGAIFGASGATIGGIVGEQLHGARNDS